MSTFKKLLALLLALAMVLSLAACGAMSSSDDDDEEEKSSGKDKDDDETEDDETEDDETEDPEEPEEKPTVPEIDEFEDEDLAYVMIYNPQIYDENARTDKSKLTTGYIGDQIEVDGNRGDGLEETEKDEWTYAEQDDLLNLMSADQINFEADRAGGLGKIYKVGDVEDFVYLNDLSRPSIGDEEFECIYEGDYCYVWSQGSGDQDTIMEYVEAFDSDIYLSVTETFGDVNMIDETGKINIVFHPISGGTMGYFCLYELFSEQMISEKEANQNGINLGHAMIHVNANMTYSSSGKKLVKQVMAHEFQHLICGYDSFNTTDQQTYNKWINEAMSGYTEEMLYPGAMEVWGRYDHLHDSELIRNGQSLYSFDSNGYDVGVYGSVYCFSEFLADKAGDDVFSKLHKYWSTSYSETLCTAEALYNSVSKGYRKEVMNSVAYSDNVKLNSEEEEFMSKLTLQFYLELLNENSKVKHFDYVDSGELLYDTMDDATIQGGGRIIVAVNGSFEFPDDADNGLVYVGLNSDFEVITEIVCK